MKEISLTQGQVALVDDEDYARLVAGFTWRADWCPSTKSYYAYGFKRGTCFLAVSRRGRTYRRYTHLPMHREVLKAKNGTEVDHINRQTLDNRKANLRSCNRAQNNMNSPKKSGCASRFKGVSRNGKWGQWKAQISINNKQSYLGNFYTEEEAAVAYNEAAHRLHGDFAVLNNI